MINIITAIIIFFFLPDRIVVNINNIPMNVSRYHVFWFLPIIQISVLFTRPLTTRQVFVSIRKQKEKLIKKLGNFDEEKLAIQQRDSVILMICCFLPLIHIGVALSQTIFKNIFFVWIIIAIIGAILIIPIYILFYKKLENTSIN